MGLALKSLFTGLTASAPQRPEITGVPMFAQEQYRGVKVRYTDLATCHVAECVIDGTAHQEIVGLGENRALAEGFHGVIDALLDAPGRQGASDDRRIHGHLPESFRDGSFPRLYEPGPGEWDGQETV